MNPHQLVRKRLKLKLRKELYKKYLELLDCYILERPDAGKKLPQKRYNKIVKKMLDEIKDICRIKTEPRKLPFE